MNTTFNNPFAGACASATMSPLDIERLARRRAGAKLGWFIHAAVFVCVNALLITISLASGKPWAIFPLMGWGLGLTIHGAAVWLGSPGSALHERLLQNERQALAAQRDPW
jgi:2TM domain